MDCSHPCNNTFSVSHLESYPVRRKFIVKEILEDLHSNTVLVRSITSECIYGLPVINSTSTIDSISFDQKHAETPMEVDSSGDYNNKTLAIRFRQKQNQENSDETDSNRTETILAPIREPSASKFFTVLLILISLFTLAGIYVITIGERFIYVNRNFQLDNIKTDLNAQVLQQENAIRIVVDSLEHISHWRDRIKVLTFIGSTGVGKTFISNIIKRHFFPELVYEISGTHLNNASKWKLVTEQLNSCCCNLIIVDNLKASDAKIVIDFIENLPKSHVILVLLIFNVQQTADEFELEEIVVDEFKMIRDDLEGSRLYYELVLFEDIERSVAENWLRMELHKRQIHESRHDRLVSFLLNHNPIKYKGFKGLCSKLMVMLDGKS